MRRSKKNKERESTITITATAVYLENLPCHLCNVNFLPYWSLIELAYLLCVRIHFIFGNSSA